MNQDFSKQVKSTYVTNSDDALKRVQNIRDAEAAEAKERALNKKSIYSSFLQVNNNNDSKKRLLLLAKKPAAMQLFLLIMQEMDDMNSLLLPTKIVMEILDISRDTVSNAFKYLESNNYIKITKAGNSNIVMLNDDIVWKTHGDKVYHSRFRTGVLITSTEQKGSELPGIVTDQETNYNLKTKPVSLKTITTKRVKEMAKPVVSKDFDDIQVDPNWDPIQTMREIDQAAGLNK